MSFRAFDLLRLVFYTHSHRVHTIQFVYGFANSSELQFKWTIEVRVVLRRLFFFQFVLTSTTRWSWNWQQRVFGFGFRFAICFTRSKRTRVCMLIRKIHSSSLVAFCSISSLFVAVYSFFLLFHLRFGRHCCRRSSFRWICLNLISTTVISNYQINHLLLSATRSHQPSSIFVAIATANTKAKLSKNKKENNDLKMVGIVANDDKNSKISTNGRIEWA